MVFYDTVLVTMMIHLGSHHRTHVWELFFQPTSKSDPSSELRIQTTEVLLLLLDVDVLGNEDGEIGVDTPLVEVGLKKSLEVLVELREGRTGVHLLG
jgi:hypothetical protein